MIVWHQVGRHIDDNPQRGGQRPAAALLRPDWLPDPIDVLVHAVWGAATSYVNRRVGGSTAYTVEMPASFAYRVSRRHAAAFLDLAARS